MEAGNSAAGYGDKKHGPHGEPFRVHVGKGDLGYRHGTEDESSSDSDCHNQENRSEKRVQAADYLIHRNDGGKKIIGQDQYEPEALLGEYSTHSQVREKSRGSVHKYRTYQYQQDDGKYPHYHPDLVAQVKPDDFRNTFSVVPDGKHSGKVVVNSTGEDGTKHDPEKGGGPEEGSHDGAENRSEACNVQELYKEDLVPGKLHIIDAVGSGQGGGLSGGIHAEYLVDKGAVDKVAPDQNGQGEKKAYHSITSLKLEFEASYCLFSGLWGTGA